MERTTDLKEKENFARCPKSLSFTANECDSNCISGMVYRASYDMLLVIVVTSLLLAIYANLLHWPLLGINALHLVRG